MTQHISFDLETLGLAHDALILSIGAVKFDPYTNTLGVPNSEPGVSTFYRVIDLSGPGGVIDAETVHWWMQQSKEARDEIFGEKVERVPLPQALAEFSEWIGFTDDLPDGAYPDVVLWARGSKDAQWLESAYKGIGFKAPFRYWQVQDQRTLTSVFSHLVPNPTPEQVAHQALQDASYQAMGICAIYRELLNCSLVVEPEPGDQIAALEAKVIDVPLVNEDDEAIRQKIPRWASERGIATVGEAVERYTANVCLEQLDVVTANDVFQGWTGKETVAHFLDKATVTPE